MDSLIIDSSYWISFFWSDDPNHTKSNKIAQIVSGKYVLLTSEDILKETLTVISQRCGRLESQKAYEAICNQCEILPTTKEVFQMALQHFFNPKLQKDISVIDCEIAIMTKTNNIRYVLTFDPHFRYLGCKIFS